MDTLDFKFRKIDLFFDKKVIISFFCIPLSETLNPAKGISTN